MDAIILAAGVSRRLYPITFETPKCLLKVGDRTILDYQLSALQSNGILNVTLIVGYYREKIINFAKRNFPDINFTFIINEHFFETNTAYSLYLCKDILKESDQLLMNGDVLYPYELLKRIVESTHDNVMAVEVKKCGREEVKVISGVDDKLVAIGKELIEENSLGESIGVAKFSQSFNTQFANSLKELITAGGKADYFEAAIHPLFEKNIVYYEDVSDLPCIEIDFVEDLENARDLAKSKWFIQNNSNR